VTRCPHWGTAKPLSAFERGRRLYIAKGCFGCHEHDGTESRAAHPAVPPALNLANRPYSEEYLTQLLAEPEKVLRLKPDGFHVSNLAIKPNQVASLVAFMNAKKKEFGGR
jgi:mono/diheme cytochrome c family protein